MPPKRPSKLPKEGPKETNSIQNLMKRRNDASISANHSTKDQAQVQEQIYILQRERANLLADFNRLKKDIADIRAKQTSLEFSILQDSSRQLEAHPEFRPLLEVWAKYTGIQLTEVLYSRDGELREWLIKGKLHEEYFTVQVVCKTDDVFNKGYVHSFSVECSAQPQVELQTWLSNNPGNIQQILTMLKAYYDKNKERTSGLELCKSEFGSIVTVAQNETGETLVELGTDDAYYFQIKWKLLPIPKFFAKVKNHCRIACTEDGDACIKANTDLTTVKKRLNQNPIEVIQLLARSIAKGNPASNKKKHTNKSMRK